MYTYTHTYTYIYIYICIQRERGIRMLVADVQGPSISYQNGPMYVSYT